MAVKKTGENVIGKGKPGPGRPKGLPNKNRRDIMALAQVHGPDCIEGIAKLMKHKNPWISLAACKEMLDRGYGKSPKAVDVNSSGNVYVSLTTFSGQILQPMTGPRVIDQPSPRPAIAATNGSGNGSTDPSAE
jgi:hypothetical protein